MLTPVLVKTGAFGEPAQTFGNIPQGWNQGGTDQNFVPEGEVWVIHAASVGQTSAGAYPPIVCSLHIEQRLVAPEGSGSHIFALMEMRPCGHGTPLLALDRPVVLLPRMRLGARFLAPPAGLQVSLMAYGFKYPLEQLAEVLHGASSAVVVGGTPTTGPDLSGLMTAAQNASEALATLAQSTPQ